MSIFVGTSGFSYKEWRGTFYPQALPERQMLAFYGTKLPAVEINNTFYRIPRAEVLSNWRGQVPETFRFVLKASRKITHIGRLADLESLAYFLKVSAALGAGRGPILFQLPPFLRKDLTVLAGFLAALPKDVEAAFEFRHASWFEPACYDLLREHGAALCGGDVEEDEKSPPLVKTAAWGYLRLRRLAYSEEQIREWATRIASQGWSRVYAFFKHEESGPALAEQLIAELSRASGKR